MYSFVISEEATLDVMEALAWYKKRNSKLSERLNLKLITASNILEKPLFHFNLNIEISGFIIAKLFHTEFILL
tara:strand:+ start:168 stop:386 length:219 start_codon:yes stop_codon:yes gene_type:complete